MRVVSTFSTPAEAHVALSRLESAGIKAVVRDEFTVTFNWLYSDAIGGVKLEVPDDDEAAAREILALPASEPGLIQCPHCGSSHASVRTLSVFGAVCLLFKIPVPMTRAFVDCRSCGKTHDVPLDGKISSKR